jgi:uncharacterized membrane protein
VHLQHQLGGFTPYDFVFWLPWYLTGIVTYAICVGGVAFCARVFHKRAFLWKDQWSSFAKGYIGLAVAITACSFMLRDTDQNWPDVIGWILMAFIGALRVFLSYEESYREELLSREEILTFDKQFFNKVSFPLMTYVTVVSVIAAILSVSEISLPAQLLAAGIASPGVGYFYMCLKEDAWRATPRHPHRRTHANDRSGVFYNSWAKRRRRLTQAQA